MVHVSRFLSTVVVGTALAVVPVAAAEKRATQKLEVVLEVKRFDVDREIYATQDLERAGKIPDEALDSIQRALIGVATRSEGFKGVLKSSAAETAPVADVVLSGRVVDYKAGNRTARLWIGMGAGAQKFAVECVVTDKATGKVLGKETIIDRKWAGITGGDEDKGLNDFAVKIIAFVQQSLATK